MYNITSIQSEDISGRFLHNNLFWISPYGELYSSKLKQPNKSLKTCQMIVSRLKETRRPFTLSALFSPRQRREARPPAELHPPGVKTGHEIKELSSSHFKDIIAIVALYLPALKDFWIKIS